MSTDTRFIKRAIALEAIAIVVLLGAFMASIYYIAFMHMPIEWGVCMCIVDVGIIIVLIWAIYSEFSRLRPHIHTKVSKPLMFKGDKGSEM